VAVPVIIKKQTKCVGVGLSREQVFSVGQQSTDRQTV